MNIGDMVEAQSGSQGWVKGEIVGVVDIYAHVLGGIMTQGQTGYEVRFLEGKHKGQVIKLPGNYLRPMGRVQYQASPQAVQKAKQLGGIKLLKLAKANGVDTTGSDAALAQKLLDKGVKL